MARPFAGLSSLWRLDERCLLRILGRFRRRLGGRSWSPRCPGLLGFCTSPSVFKPSPFSVQHRRHKGETANLVARIHDGAGWAARGQSTGKRRMMTTQAAMRGDRFGQKRTDGKWAPSNPIHHICIRHQLRLPDVVSTQSVPAPNCTAKPFWAMDERASSRRERDGGLGWGGWPPSPVASTHLICQVSRGAVRTHQRDPTWILEHRPTRLTQKTLRLILPRTTRPSREPVEGIRWDLFVLRRE